MSPAAPSTARVFIVAANAGDMEALRPARETLDSFGVAWTEKLITAPGAGSLDASDARMVIVAAPDAVLPSALAAANHGASVVRVPVAGAGRAGIALLHDPMTADLPAGDAPFATVAIGEAGAKNAALLVVSILGLNDATLWEEWLAYRQRQTDAVLAQPPLAQS